MALGTLRDAVAKTYFFFRQGYDLLITKPDGEFVMMFPGASANAWFKGAEVFPH